MNIVIITNTFTPHVGGVARSVEGFRKEYLDAGHNVLVIAPEFEGMPTQEDNVIRVSAIQNFNASDFSVVLPLPKGINRAVEEFEPDIIHSQHPFLLGMTAVRLARILNVPLAFTHHTLYEQYTHYVPGDSPLLQNFVIELATHYANLSDQVIAPSESIRDLVMERGVRVPVEVIPTGVDVEKFADGNGQRCRGSLNIPDTAWVVGHMGRLAPEKNIRFLSRGVLEFIKSREQCYFLVVGDGDESSRIIDIFSRAGLQDRLVLTGTLEKQDLSDALCAMDVFAFASKSETQGMVLIEAMAAGLPVVAVDASGAREVIEDRGNGRLLQEETVDSFSAALDWVHQLDGDERLTVIRRARDTARQHSMQHCAQRALDCFRRLHRQNAADAQSEEKAWEQVLARIKSEWDIMKSLASAGDGALSGNRSE